MNTKDLDVEINKMWLDKEKTRYDVGWNSALAELEARFKLKQHQKKLLVKYKNMKKKIQLWLHNVLGWGFPVKNQGRIGGDSFQSTYQCQFCDYEITRDSTGAWFHLSSKIKQHQRELSKEKEV